jgi:hypothetical protein
LQARFEELQANQAAQEARQEALRLQQEAAHQQQIAALTRHYQRQLADLTGYFCSQIPGTQEPPLLFAPPPIPVPAPVQAPVSILLVALACAAILQVLITSLGLCAGAIGGFEPDSRYQPSTGSFSTPRLASLLDLPHAAVRVASSTVAGLLLVAARADVAGALRVDVAGALAALLDVQGSAAVRLVSVGARWGL